MDGLLLFYTSGQNLISDFDVHQIVINLIRQDQIVFGTNVRVKNLGLMYRLSITISY